MQFFRRSSPQFPTADEALPGRSEAIEVPANHYVNGASLTGPWPDGTKTALFALGCFWGAEKDFWETPGVVSTAVGYVGGTTPNPTYREVCSGRTGHSEAVLVAYDPTKVSYEELLKVFWENHDPTQGMRQGNDVGTQYRSAIFTLDDEQLAAARASRAMYQDRLKVAGYGEITTEIAPAPAFYYAEEYHQQYLAKNPFGYCPNHATGVTLPEDFVTTPLQYVD
ncbi:MAG TPA: peptide-methionine (S)-S-oxide reductase MsrA [Candidatus Limnocylindrales bacterium]|nr:peptide-methionine (S)-S-oxide reductase MsrA [Candidatus Limnocylindrales bacterium]